MTQIFKVSFFDHKRDNVAQAGEWTWAQICKIFREPEVRRQKDGPLFSPALFDPPRRANIHVKELSMLVLDLDHACDLGQIKARFSSLGITFLISSTHSHLCRTKSNPRAEPRFRVVIPLAKPIQAHMYSALWQYTKQTTALPLDEAAKDVSRPYYSPSIAEESAPYELYIHEGKEMDWESLPLEDFSHPFKSANAVNSYSALQADQLPTGRRNAVFFKLAKKLYGEGLPLETVTCTLLFENRRRCVPPLPESEVKQIAINALNYPIGSNGHSESNFLPIPLPDNTQTPQLDEIILPEAWQPWLADVSERLQCPLDYAAIAAVIAASTLIGNRLRIRPKRHDSWTVVPNLWGAIIGSPGVMKTPAINEGLFFLNEIVERERARFAISQKEAEFEKQCNESLRAELLKDMKKKGVAVNKEDLRRRFDELECEVPVEKRLLTNDVTVEKLGELLNENLNGLLILRDELMGWLKQMERPGHEQDRAFYLEAWNGGNPFTFDRIGRGTTFIKSSTISVLGSIQPSMIEPYYRSAVNGIGNDGLIQRFQLMVFPEIVKKYDYVDRPPQGRDAARKSFNNLYTFTPADVGASFMTPDAGGHAFLRFDDAAQEFFQNWLVALETELRSGTIQTPALESHVAKYRSLMPSLALIFHLLNMGCGKTEIPLISLDSAMRAADWCNYLRKHAEKLYAFVSPSETECAREILKRVRVGKLPVEFTARDVYTKHWKGLNEREIVIRSLELLSERGYLESIRLETFGRYKTLYKAHKSLRVK